MEEVKESREKEIREQIARGTYHNFLHYQGFGYEVIADVEYLLSLLEKQRRWKR